METPKPLQIQTSAELQMRFFGSEAAVFDVGSAQTHLLTASGAVVLHAIGSGVRERSELEKVLAESMPHHTAAELASMLEVYLESFDQLGLLKLAPKSDSK
ncbi:MAG: PqqD family protein of HPr-rel-A system [Halioglobus sp.]|jgi:PqqD family protein of HPr-rel-A system